jgi:hypothetical protein
MRSLGKSGGVEQFVGTDKATGDLILKTVADNHEVIERNKQIEGLGMGKELRLAASIPPGVQYEWLDKFGIEFWNPAHKDGVRRLLNSSDYRYLRVNHFMM